MIDAHAHLTDAAFAEDRDAVIARAAAAGVVRILTCGEDVPSSEAAVALAERHPALLRVAVGIHPHRAEDCDAAALKALRALAAHPLVVAIGEIGVDRSGRSAPLEAQRRALAGQLALAAEVDLPVVLHLRDAPADLQSALGEAAAVRGQLHCYSEGPDELAAWRARGLIPSFAGTVTFKGNAHLREAALAADHLLVETDAPYLAPEPRRGGRNEPARVRDTYERLAALRGVSVEQVAMETAATAAALFGARW